MERPSTLFEPEWNKYRMQNFPRIPKREGYGYNSSPITDQNRIIQEFGQKMLLENTSPHGTIVEIGCSVGHTTQELREVFPESKIIVLEIQQHLLEHTKKKLLPNDGYTMRPLADHFIAADGYDLPLAPLSVDTLFWMNSLVQSLNSIGFSEQRSITHRIKRVLKPQATFFLSGYVDGKEQRFILKKGSSFSEKFQLIWTNTFGEYIQEIQSETTQFSKTSQPIKPRVVYFLDNFMK
jgi:ubiquinone/menaquinone biosynthesis C-methylase UbiE